MWFDALVDLKRRSGKTLKQISDESGVPLGTLNKLFAGQTKDPKLKTVRSVVYSLGYTLDDLDTSHDIKKSPGTEESEPGGKVISLEDSNRLLVALGFIEEGQQLSDGDLAFLTHVIGLLEAWFRESK